MSIHEKACLVKLHISMWTASRKDKKKTDELCEANGTTDKWMRANKNLINRDAVKPIAAVASAARAYHDEVTLPWDDMGWRILPAALYVEYVAKINGFKEQMDNLVRDLAKKFDHLKEEARKHLNGAFNEADYPDDISDRYGMSTQVSPIPEGQDLRISVGSAELARLRKTIEADVQSQIADSVKNIWQRMREMVDVIVERMKDEKPVFYVKKGETEPSIIVNLKSLVEIVPKLNIVGDKDLDKMAQAVKQNLTTYTGHTLRRSKRDRKELGKKAKDALKKLDWYMARK